MPKVSKITSEEIEQHKQIVLKLLKQGASRSNISTELNKSTTYVAKIVKILVDEKSITREKIEQARLKKRRDNRKKANIEKKLRAELNQKNKEKVLEGLKRGKTPDELIIELNLTKNKVEKYIRELMIEGKISYDDLAIQKNEIYRIAKSRNEDILNEIKSGMYTIKELSARHNMPEAVIEHIAEQASEPQETPEDTTQASTNKTQKLNLDINKDIILTNDEKSVLQWLIKGYQFSFISESLEIPEMELLIIIGTLEKKGVITQDQINDAQNQKRLNDEKDIIYYLKLGYRQADILKTKPEFSITELFEFIAELKKTGKITDEEIEEARDNISDKMYLLSKKFQTENKRNPLKNKEVEQGQTHGILEQSQTDEIAEHRRKYSHLKDIDFESQTDAAIFELIKKGARPQEIANYFKMSEESVTIRCQSIIKQFNITKEDLELFEQERKILYTTTREEAKREIDDKCRSISNRKGFFALASDEVKYGNDLKKSDIVILGNCIISNSRLLNKTNLRFVVMQYIKLGNFADINKYLNELLIAYEDFGYGEILRAYKEFTVKRLLRGKKTSPDFDDDWGDK